MVSGGCAYFPGTGGIELDAYAELLRTDGDDSGHCDIAVGNDDLLVKVNRPVRTRYLHLAEARGRSIFGEPEFKADGRL